MTGTSAKPCLSAVFVDYDNIYLSLKRKNEEAAKRFAKDAGSWVKEIASGRLITPTNTAFDIVDRRIVMNRCYGNPVPRRNTQDNSTDMNSFPFVRHHFLRSGFEVIDCPPLTAQLKNSSDIRMVMDVRDFLTHDTYFDEFVILSGDADFTPVLHRLRAHARRTVIFANDYTAAPYTSICDGEIRESDLINLLVEGRLPGEVSGEGAILIETDSTRNEAIRAEIIHEVVSGVRAAAAPVPLEALADRALRSLGHDKTAGTGWAGAGGFRELLSQALPDEIKLSAQAPYYAYDVKRHAEPLVAEPLVAKPLVAKPLVAKPLVVEPLAAKPLAVAPLAVAPLAVEAPAPQAVEDAPQGVRAPLQAIEAPPQAIQAAPAQAAPVQAAPVQAEPAQAAPAQAEAAPAAIQQPGGAPGLAPAAEIALRPLQPAEQSYAAAAVVATPAASAVAPAPVALQAAPAAALAAPAPAAASAPPAPPVQPQPAPEVASAVQQSIARIHDACQAPPLAPPEYRVLFEVMSAEINENGLTGTQTLTNIATRAQESGIELRRDDVRFVLEVVSEADPWFEQGASANLFAGRFRNFVVARCRGQGLNLSADELDLIEAWFAGSGQQLPGGSRTAAPAGAQQQQVAELNNHIDDPSDIVPAEDMPLIIRSRLRG